MAETRADEEAKPSTETSRSSVDPSASTSKPSTKAEVQAFNYSNAESLSKKPEYIHLQWPNFEDFMNDKNQDVPEVGQLMDEFCTRVSDLGFPVSEVGSKLVKKLDKEEEKRDQNRYGMHIYEDWNGWGISECFENFLKDFNKNIFKQTVSPFKKWAYVEGIACFLKSGGLEAWLGNEDGDSVKAIAAMFGLMILTSYSALAEHSLFSPDSEIKNIGFISLLMLEFAQGDGCDLDIGWGCEIVRMCDDARINLDNEVRKQVSVSKKDLDNLRDIYKEKRERSDFDLALEFDGNGYKAYAETPDWKPKDDLGDDGEKMWYRWDWKLEYNEFRKNHKGGSHYDLTKWSRQERKEYTLGTKAFGRRMEMEIESDSEWEDIY